MGIYSGWFIGRYAAVQGLLGGNGESGCLCRVFYDAYLKITENEGKVKKGRGINPLLIISR
jgi:hypothetical protein